MRQGKYIACFITLILLSGCGQYQRITYPLEDVQTIAASPFSNFALVLRQFEDLREPLIKEGSWNEPATVTKDDNDWYYNTDDWYEGDAVALQITKIIAEHLQAVKFFKTAQVDEGGDVTADFVLEGKIKTFEGFKEEESGGWILLAILFPIGGPAIAAIGQASESSKYEATTVLEEVRLLNVATNTIVWEGDVEGKVEGEEPAIFGTKGPWGAYEKANISLRRAVDKLMTKLMRVRP